jgi:hypothetical protein
MNLIKKINKSEENIKKGKFIKADTSMKDEKMLELLIK